MNDVKISRSRCCQLSDDTDYHFIKIKDIYIYIYIYILPDHYLK